jgi:isocitrate dehydrogenase
LAKALAENETKITSELIESQSKPQDIGGYYHPNHDLASKAMRPSATLNHALASL